ncbi:MAG: cell wall hydrolase [Lachnospiraceae bacterium]|nr:cell wall hydrolase [Lachnospiraceae bacterium]
MYKISNKYRLTAILTALALALSSTFSFAGVTPVYATELEDTITDLEAQQKETQDAMERLKEQQENTQDNVDELSDQSKDLQNIYAGYASQMSNINNEITKVQESLQETSQEIVSLNNELSQAQAEEKQIYENLKKCLKASYENGSRDSMIMLLYNSSSMEDFLTKAEYVSAFIQYEQNLMASYRSIQDEISKKAEKLEEKQTELDSYQSELDGKQSELADLTQKVKGELSDTNDELANENEKLKDYDKQIKQLDKKMANLQAQQAAAQAELAQKIAKQQAEMAANGIKEDFSGSYAASASELEWLAATIQAEADGESYTGKLAVGTVIMNRVKSSVFPNSIVGVITQTNQFASYRSGKVELIIAKGPNSTCMQAAQEVLNGARVGDYLFFMTKYYADYYRIAEYTMIGNHAFFYRWIAKDPEPTAPIETPADTTTNTPADTPADTPTDTPTDNSANTPTDTPADTPSDTSTDTPADTTTNTPAN